MADSADDVIVRRVRSCLIDRRLPFSVQLDRHAVHEMDATAPGRGLDSWENPDATSALLEGIQSSGESSPTFLPLVTRDAFRDGVFSRPHRLADRHFCPFSSHDNFLCFGHRIIRAPRPAYTVSDETNHTNDTIII